MLGRSPKSISGQNNLITQRNTKKNNRQDNPADCFFSLCHSHNLQTMALLSKPQLPTRPIRTKILKKSKRRLRKPKRRFIFAKRRYIFVKWRFVLFVFLLRLIEKHKILSSKQKNIILLLLR